MCGPFVLRTFLTRGGGKIDGRPRRASPAISLRSFASLLSDFWAARRGGVLSEPRIALIGMMGCDFLGVWPPLCSPRGRPRTFPPLDGENLDALPPVSESKVVLYGTQGGNCDGYGTHFLPQHLTVDHIVARSRGRDGCLDELWLLCGWCNSLEGNGLVECLGWDW